MLPTAGLRDLIRIFYVPMFRLEFCSSASLQAADSGP
jgi:hypothetical protein